MSIGEQVEQINVLIVGASQGIGLGFVSKLLLQNKINRVYAIYRQPDSASSLVQQTQSYADKLTCLRADVTREEEIISAVEIIKQQVEKLHLVINCVGILHQNELQPEKSLRQIESERLLRYFEINSIPSVLLAKHLLPLFRHQDSSVFAAISAKIGSIGDNRLGGWYGYRASKAALNMLMKTVAIEYGRVSPKTIVVTLHPGTTDTHLSRPFQKNVPPEKLFSVERCVNQLLKVIDHLTINDTGQFFSWDGNRLPW